MVRAAPVDLDQPPVVEEQVTGFLDRVAVSEAMPRFAVDVPRLEGGREIEPSQCGKEDLRGTGLRVIRGVVNAPGVLREGSLSIPAGERLEQRQIRKLPSHWGRPQRG